MAVRLGAYGRLGPQIDYTEEGARRVAESKLDFYRLQRCYEYDPSHKPLAKIIKDAGKKLHLRTMFNNKPPFLSNSTYLDWTDMRNTPSMYDDAVRIMSEEIEDWGPGNLWGYSFNEEEPRLSYKASGKDWYDLETLMAYDWAVEDYLYGHNLLYDRMKALYPGLMISGTFNWMMQFSDTDIKRLKVDALMAGYYSYLPGCRPYFERLVRLGTEMGLGNNIFGYIFAATTPPDYSEPDGDWQLIRPILDAAIGAGMQNVYFYTARHDIDPGENMFFVDYPPTPIETQTTPEIRRTDPYWHMKTVLELLDEYAVTPNGTRYVVPTVIIVIIILIAIFAGRGK